MDQRHEPAHGDAPINTKLDGQDLSRNKDPIGKRLFVEFVEVVKAVFKI